MKIIKLKLKAIVINWLAIYPIITGVLFFLEPSLVSVVLPVKTLILTVIVVPLMVFIAVPATSTIFDKLRNQLRNMK